MDKQQFLDNAGSLQNAASDLAVRAHELAMQATHIAATPATQGDGGFVVFGLTVFVLAVFVGYYVVWRVTPALHSPLMAVTNAISSVVIVGALIAAGPAELTFSKLMGFFAVILASINIFGGFIVTQRMLAMFRQKKPDPKKPDSKKTERKSPSLNATGN